MYKVSDRNQVSKPIEDATGRETAVRACLAQYGYRIMHRRNGQYWVMLDNPMTLDQIETWARPREAR